MGDEGFDFKPAPPRREARPFEPPPWEREAFDRLAREREAQRLAEEAARRAAEEAATAEAGGVPAGTPATLSGAQNAAQAAPAQPAVAVDPITAEPARELDPKEVDLLLMELKAEEVPAMEGAWKVAVGSGVALALVGLVVVLWGFMAVVNRRLGPTGVLGGGVMVTFGLAALAGGGFLIMRALRQRGVL